MTHAAPTAKPPREVELDVGGMHCAGCAAAVRRALEDNAGVQTVNVNHQTGEVRVTGDELHSDDLIRSVEAAGFEAAVATPRESAAARRVAIEASQHAHAAAWRRRAVIGLTCWIILATLHWFFHGPWVPWALFAGGTVAMIVAGGGFYRSAWNAARRGRTNMDTLISMGATAAYVFSTVTLFARQWGALVEQPLYFGEAAALLGIISLGHWLEARAAARAGSAVRELLELQPDTAERLTADGDTEATPTADIRPGDRLVIRPGARIPVDGEVVEGETEVDASIVTGEPLTVLKQPGDEVIAGSLNTTGRIVLESTVDGRETTVARIADLVERAQTSKASIERLADRVSAVFVPVVLIIALGTVLGWGLIGGDWPTGVISATTVLVISCPCALGLATPMAVMVGAGAASKRGVLVKGAASLERAGALRHVIFDKTGTLTEGAPQVDDVTPRGDWSEAEVIRLAAAVEQASEHPLGRAIVAASDGALPDVTDFEATPGQGVSGTVENAAIEVRRATDASCEVVRDGVVIGTIAISDAVRPETASIVRTLRDEGMQVWMLTGDRDAAAQRLARQIDLPTDHVKADVTPEDKLDFVRERGEGTAMVGDGVNDAAALAAADLGVAIGTGTNIAMESADVVIRRVASVVDLVHIARATLRTIRQNLFFAFFYNAAAIPAAALGLLGPMGPLWAAAAMGLSDICVIGNALRLKRRLARSGPFTPDVPDATAQRG